MVSYHPKAHLIAVLDLLENRVQTVRGAPILPLIEGRFCKTLCKSLKVENVQGHRHFVYIQTYEHNYDHYIQIGTEKNTVGASEKNT